MAPIPDREFVAALRGLSRRELAAFVADLWAARGYETRVEGEAVVVAGDRRLGVRHDARRFARLRGGASFEDVDAVVTSSPDSPDGGSVTPSIDAGDLREMALYALDRDACRALFDRHLDRAPTATPTDAGGRRLRAASVAGSAALLVGLALLAVGAGFGAPSSPPPPAEPAEPAAGTAVPPDADGTTPAPDDPGKGYPPGTDRFGVVNASRVAAAHSRAVADRPHRFTLTYRLQRNGTTAASKRRTARFHNATVYRSRAEWQYGAGNDSAVRGSVATYADGRVALRRVSERGETWYERTPLDRRQPEFVDRPARLIRRYLAVERSWLVDLSTGNESPAFWVIGTGRAPSNAADTADVTVNARITPSGVVRAFRASYRRDGGGRVVITFRLAGLDDTAVAPPPWVERARAATAD